MNTRILYGLSVMVAWCCCVTGCSQEPSPEQAYTNFWQKTDREFADVDKSPLDDEARAAFDSVPRYAFDAAYRVEAEWEPLTGQKPMTFETTGPRKQRYQKVGILHFEIDSTKVHLSAYRNLDLMRNAAYRDRLFVPFTDATSGVTTYGGGRYVELEVPEGERAVLDFNRAYNPYCVYSDRYSCPIPPRENHLDVEIRAGARVE